jgi:anaerobic ribonucleoside-triphosphate reductase activating protein
MRNGEGLRVTLFVSGCDHHCKGCHNPQTWDCNSGIEFDMAAKEEIFKQLNKEYISGITFTGGDPLHKNNLDEVLELCRYIRKHFPTKTIWIYTGYSWEYIFDTENTVDVFSNQIRVEILKECDVLVDGRFIQELADTKYHWAGSTNQRVIDIKKSLKKGCAIRWNN